jgi:hypothetical protein
VPGSDGFPAKFFQNNWNIIFIDLLKLFQDFYDGKLDIPRISYGIISLSPKIEMFRPMCLLNVIFKIFTKLSNKRAILVADKVISIVQSAFI